MPNRKLRNAFADLTDFSGPRKERNRESPGRELRREAGTKFQPPKPKLRQANFDDYEQIAAVQARNGLGSRSRQNWLAFWQDNPAYRQRAGKFPIGWVLEDAQSRIVGWIGNLPSTYHFRGTELLSVTPSPWVTDESHRSYSVLLLHRFTRQKDVDIRMFTTGGPTSGPVSRLFGYSKVPVGSWDKSAFWVTNYFGFVRAALSRKGIPLARSLTYPVGAALFLKDRVTLIKDRVTLIDVKPRTGTSEVEARLTFDVRFDDFWEELKKQRGNILLATRTRETLLWHFRDQVERRRIWIITASKCSLMTAYALFAHEDTAFGLRRVRLVDFQALPGSEGVLPSFLSRALEKCHYEDIHLLEITGGWLQRSGLPVIMAPYHRNLASWTFYYRAYGELARILRDPRVWAPSSFDGDAGM